VRRLLAWSLLLMPGLFSGPLFAAGFTDLWLTRDQQGQRLLERERFTAAAQVFEDPARRATACYRGADFECAAGLWGALRSAEAAYNRGNALILLGRYEEAIESYDRALDQRPDWAEAVQNREIARLRAQRLEPVEDDAGGTGGALGADEIRFDDSGRVDSAGSEVTEEAETGSTPAEMRAVWLRRVESDPADFLRARFMYQTYAETLDESQ
jgi:Ca-activated chloride channel family protein